MLWGTDIGGDVTSSPTLANGTLYIGSGTNGLYALNADTGAIVWVTVTGGPVHSTPIVADGTVYLGTPRSTLIGTEPTNIYAYDANTGAILWGTDIGGDVTSSPTLANGTLYIGSGTNGLYAFAIDSDDDGVLDGVDDCPGTVPDSINQGDLKNRRYGVVWGPGVRVRRCRCPHIHHRRHPGLLSGADHR
ncbi:MAG: PQQ-like beta-propeller repeat protein [Acidimicrobiia bacterium]|nr:PQQ-like beta-propeller repeat protein [Acidimicrobiia bacterium]